ncbi:MAG: TIM barrel protein [Spirosomataceae bacterium]
MEQSRRDFLKKTAFAAMGAGLLPGLACQGNEKKLFFEISLAEWSLHRTLRAGKLDNLDFAATAKNEFGIDIIEYVNQFFKDKAEDTAYLKDLLQRSKDNGVRNHLIMIDGEGGLGDTDDAARTQAVENHYKWVEAAKFLECETIRVNAYGEGSADDVGAAAVDGLGRLGEFAAKVGINVIVENHGGYSSNGTWLANVMKQVNRDNVGTLPDFGNFCVQRDPNDWKICIDEYDRYQGTQELMPYAKGVSAKSYDFDEKGDVIETDYYRMLKIVKDAGFKGIIGIEYEGDSVSEYDGIRATKLALERVGAQI